MALTGKRNIIELSENEFCYNCEYTGIVGGGGTMKMYVPKLMSDIGLQEPIVLPYIFGGDTVFGNDDACKPGASKSFAYQNYLEIPLLYNNDDGWEHIKDGAGMVPKGTKFLCTFVNNDLTKAHFTTNL